MVLHYGYLDLDELLAAFAARRPMLHVVCTGRNAPQALIDCFPELCGRAGECAFTGCSHDTDEGCAVRAAVQAGRHVFVEKPMVSLPAEIGNRPPLTPEQIMAVYELGLKAERHFGKVREILMSDDAVYNLAALIEGHENLNRLSKQNISSFLPITEQTRSGILSTAQSYLKVVNSDSALRSLSKSTISLDRLTSRRWPLWRARGRLTCRSRSRRSRRTTSIPRRAIPRHRD